MRGFYLKGFLKGMDVNAALTLLVVFLLAISSENAVCQTPPPNDNLTNATVLTGTDITFTGTLVSATLESSNEAIVLFGSYDSNYVNASIWWSWTAPVSTVLNLQVNWLCNAPLNTLAIYSSPVSGTSPANLPQPVAVWPLFAPASLVNQAYSIPVIAGSNYLFQLIGVGFFSFDGKPPQPVPPYTFRLLATNSPWIFKQPLNQTVYPNGSSIFYVETAGLLPRAYQWFFNGTNLPEETAPILALNNIDSSRVGSYSCFISNASGSVMSDSATLTINPSNNPPVLKAISFTSNVMSLYLMGESGRAYHIQTSPDRKGWTELNTFPFAPQILYGQLGNIVFCSNSASLVTVTNQWAYYRAFIPPPTNTPDSEVCINNLRQIMIAKQLWLSDTHGFITETPAYSQISQYVSHPTKLVCPADTVASFFTSYTIQQATTAPTCDIRPVDHLLNGVP